LNPRVVALVSHSEVSLLLVQDLGCWRADYLVVLETEMLVFKIVSERLLIITIGISANSLLRSLEEIVRRL